MLGSIPSVDASIQRLSSAHTAVASSAVLAGTCEVVATSSEVADCVFPFSHPENEIAAEMQIKAHKATLESLLNLFVFIFCFLSGFILKHTSLF